MDQGFTCLAARTAQSLAPIDLEGYPTLARLNNSNRKHITQYINKTVHQKVPNC
jgi:hypothetical protein